MVSHYKSIGIPIFILALLAGFSRIWAGLHYPFDVVGSLMVTVVVSYTIVKLSRLFDSLLNYPPLTFGHCASQN
ncbi:phosphatase PAP2 family protein [Peribacillus loiseleuriae]|uniref:phosphatase PAP2 family protein n=1 Tax=Peribacillus loiseleuriae TaxID=1679170 RepID=UPI000A8BABD1|nr:phosphatase PAP2 family protein [Peribacillus loiseleuriae]